MEQLGILTPIVDLHISIHANVQMSDEPVLAQACQRCWRRKQKCGRQRPECSECARAGAQCIPRVWGRVLDDPGQGGNLDLSSASLIEQMKNRINFLERAHDQPSGEESTGGLQTSPGTDVSVHVTNGAGEKNPYIDTGGPSETNSYNDTAAHEVEYLSVAAMSGPDGQTLPLHDNPTFATLVNEAIKLGDDPQVIDTMPPSRPLSLLSLQEELVALCRRNLRDFIDQYCEGVGHVYPCISSNSCREAVDLALQLEQGSAVSQNDRSSSEYLLIACLVSSLSIINSPHYQIAEPIVQRLVAGSFALLPMVSAEASDTEAVRCLILAAIVAMYRFNEGSSWHFLGLAITKAISAGIHRQKQPNDEDDSTQLFWALYKLDRRFAFVLDRPFSIEDGDMTVQPPPAGSSPPGGAYHHFDPRSVFIWTIHYAQMLSSWRRQTNADLDELYSGYEYWRETCGELINSVRHHGNANRLATAQLLAVLALNEKQLACRALVQLLILSFGKSQGMKGLLEGRLQYALRAEIPQLLADYKNGFDAHNFAPTILDAYDVVGATIAYIWALQQPSTAQSGCHQVTGNPLAVSDMRLFTLAMDVLQRMAQRFAPVSDFQELLWSFLTVLEQKAGHPHGRTSNANLQDAFSRCRLSIPDHLAALMVFAAS